MSKRKPRYEGPAYCDYQDLFDRITTELENLYHTLWDKRKEAPKFRTMGKQAKTAWMLWKLGSMEYWRREGEGLHFTNQLEERCMRMTLQIWMSGTKPWTNICAKSDTTRPKI